MAWNEPGGGEPKDPWGNNRGNQHQGPPDLDELLRKLGATLGGLLGGGGKGGGTAQGDGGSGMGGLLLGLLVLLLFLLGYNALYTINQQERGIVLRFGRYESSVMPGLHWKIPLIDALYKVNVTRVRDRNHRSLMLTEDENIVDVSVTVQYVVSDPKDFLLRVRDPESALENATESALRHVVGTSKMDRVISEGREQIGIDVHSKMQEYLNLYQSGIQISKVNIEEAKPPKEVQAAFDDVIKAREDEARFRNEAEAYANGIVPEARGYAQRQIQEAEGYKEGVIARAQGDALRFQSMVAEYQKAPELTRQRLYIDAIESVLGNSSKVLIDQSGGNNMIYLPLDRLAGAAATPTLPPVSTTPAFTADSGVDVGRLTDRVIEELRNRQNSSRSRESR